MNPSCKGLMCVLLAALGWMASAWTAQSAAPVDNSFSIRVWRAEDGLPENRVVGIAQASDGYLWVATQVGVVRFDGVRFQPVMWSDQSERFSGTMRGLLLDRDNRIWIAREGGLLVSVDAGEVRVVAPGEDLLRNETQRSIAVDGERHVWVSYTSGKVVRFRDGTVDTYGIREGLPSGGVASLASGRDGVLWFTKNGRVGQFKQGRFEPLLNLGNPSTRITPSRAGGLWICAAERVLHHDIANGTVEIAEIPETVEATVLHEDRSGALWIGTASSGLFRCESNTVTRVPVSHPSILSLAEDREGNLWVGTRGGGLNRLHRRVMSLIDSKSGAPFEGAQSLCQDTEGALWVVGEDGVLARFKEGRWQTMVPDPNAPNIHVNCVAADADGGVWVGTRGGSLYRWSHGRFVGLGLREALGGRSVRCLLVTRAGDLWVGTDGSEPLHRLRTEKLQLQKFNLKPGFRFVRAITEDAEGNVWAGATDGLLVRISGEEVINETPLTGGYSIRSLHGAANGDVWIGFAGFGAGRIRNGVFTRFNRDQGMPNDYVSQIQSDRRGGIWFAGNQGIFQVREKDFDDVAEGRQARLSPVVYGRDEGMLGLQASFDFAPSALHTSDDRLFFSLLTGVAEVRLKEARLNRFPPVVFIESVSADGQRVAALSGGREALSTNQPGPMELGAQKAGTELRLRPGLQLVQFEFTALSFVAPENVRFRYQLVGLDEGWVDGGSRRVADYTYPPPGRYRFRVAACNNDGVWNEAGDELAVVFAPYFWETLWFKVALVTVISGSLCALVAMVLRRRHRLQIERLEHQRMLDRERTRIAHDLHDDLGVGLTEIGLLGDLAVAAPGLPETSREYLHELTGRARSLVASLDEIVWAINPANDTSQSLSDYLLRYSQTLLQRAGIRCRLEVVEPLPSGSLNAEERHQLFHSFKEALNNVLRHSGATEVRISLSSSIEGLVVRIADNGRGFHENMDAVSRNGLKTMRERMHHLGGRCEIASSVGGTTVTFVVPVHSESTP